MLEATAIANEQVIVPETDESVNDAETVTPETETAPKEPTVQELQAQISKLQSAKDTGYATAQHWQTQYEALVEKLTAAQDREKSPESDIDPDVAEAIEVYGEGSLPHRLAVRTAAQEKERRKEKEQQQQQVVGTHVGQIVDFFEKNGEAFKDKAVMETFNGMLSSIVDFDVVTELASLVKGQAIAPDKAKAISRSLEVALNAALHKAGKPVKKPAPDNELPKKPAAGMAPEEKNPLKADISKMSYRECIEYMKHRKT